MLCAFASLLFLLAWPFLCHGLVTAARGQPQTRGTDRENTGCKCQSIGGRRDDSMATQSPSRSRFALVIVRCPRGVFLCCLSPICLRCLLFDVSFVWCSPCYDSALHAQYSSSFSHARSPRWPVVCPHSTGVQLHHSRRFGHMHEWPQLRSVQHRRVHFATTPLVLLSCVIDGRAYCRPCDGLEKINRPNRQWLVRDSTTRDGSHSMSPEPARETDLDRGGLFHVVLGTNLSTCIVRIG